VRKLIHANRQAPAGQVIAILNPVIRGWAQYHQHVVSKAVFAKVDTAIFQALWRWAVRRHPNKGKCGIKQKYFNTIGSRNWVFHGSYNGKE
jgi:RNA-directed DNA polymerase